MIRLLSLLLLLLGVLAGPAAQAQELELPRKSPRAGVSHTVGMTRVDIDYSSPAVRGRNIWGDLVPYGQVWRAGANEATTLQFSHDVWIGNQLLPAGKYALFLLPQENGRWEAIFNSQSDQWGAYDYNERLDVLRVPITVDTLCTREERLLFSLSDKGLDQGTVCMRWDVIEACFDFRVPVLDQIDADVRQAVAGSEPGRAWMIYAQAADFLATYDDFIRRALDYAIQSTSRHDHPWNWWLRAQLEARIGDYENAVLSAQRCLTVGQQHPDDRFFVTARPTIEQKLAEWRAM